MLVIKNKDKVAETLHFVARKMKLTTRIMKRNPDDTRAIANILLCKQLLQEILEENTDKAERAAIEYVYLQR